MQFEVEVATQLEEPRQVDWEPRNLVMRMKIQKVMVSGGAVEQLKLVAVGSKILVAGYEAPLLEDTRSNRVHHHHQDCQSHRLLRTGVTYSPLVLSGPKKKKGARLLCTDHVLDYTATQRCASHKTLS